LVLEPLDNNAPVELPVDIGISCPPGATGMYFGKMYTIEFVERCLNAIPKPAEGISKVDLESLKNMAQEIIGTVRPHVS
jgi:kinesin family member 2/24